MKKCVKTFRGKKKCTKFVIKIFCNFLFHYQKKSWESEIVFGRTPMMYMYNSLLFRVLRGPYAKNYFPIKTTFRFSEILFNSQAVFRKYLPRVSIFIVIFQLILYSRRDL